MSLGPCYPFEIISRGIVNVSSSISVWLYDLCQTGNKSNASYGFPSKQCEDAQSFLGQVAVGLHAVPVRELEGQQVPAVLRAHGLRQQQGQTVVSWGQIAAC